MGLWGALKGWVNSEIGPSGRSLDKIVTDREVWTDHKANMLTNFSKMDGYTVQVVTLSANVLTNIQIPLNKRIIGLYHSLNTTYLWANTTNNLDVYGVRINGVDAFGSLTSIYNAMGFNSARVLFGASNGTLYQYIDMNAIFTSETIIRVKAIGTSNPSAFIIVYTDI